MNKSKWLITILVLLMIVLGCCILVIALGAGGYYLYSLEPEAMIPTPIIRDFPTPEEDWVENDDEKTEEDWKENEDRKNEDGPGVIFSTEIPPLTEGAYETLNTLKEEIIPANDARDLALRLEGKTNIPETLEQPAKDYDVGDEEYFWITDMDTDEHSEINAKLAYETPHAYFWIEEGLDYDEYDLLELAETFENQIYPTDREFFGSEWSPGIDGDEHLYIVFSRGLGYSIAGYFSSVDSVHPLAHEFSNAHETFMMNADTIGLDEDFTYGVLAHEFQHMIHWYQDRNETTWLNEGFSELAAYLNNYYESYFDAYYIWQPDIQLNSWPDDQSQTTPHYGASFLFVEYFLERFGEDATQQVVANPENGMDSIDIVLSELNEVDPVSGLLVGADDVFGDWVVANYVMDGSVADGRYNYYDYRNAPQAMATEIIDQCPVGWQTRDVQQYGVDYIDIDCTGKFTLNFEGGNEVGVLPINPYSGDYAFWSNKGDESDMTLTRLFDFSGVDGKIEMNYKVWYDIEENYDYVYLVASVDGDQWDMVRTPSGTDEDLTGNNYDWGYNGQTIEWIQEQVDLSRYAGQQVYLRFEYVTDAAVNGEGFMIDDISIPQINYQTDFETDNGGWENDGFVRLQNRLPQTYKISLIKTGVQSSVETISLDSENRFSLPLEIDDRIDDVVLVVSGTTRFTSQPAIYRFSVTE